MTSLLEIRQKAQGRQPTDILSCEVTRENTGETTREAMHKAAAAYHARHTNQASPDYWEHAIADLMEVSRQHDNRPLIVDLLAAVLKDLERDYKGAPDTCRSAAADRQTAAHERPTN